MSDVRNWIEPLRENGMPRLAAALEEQCDLVDRLQEAVGVPLSAADTAAIESTVDALFKEHTPMANHTNKGKTMRYRKKPVVIEAIQLRWDTWSEMCDFVGVGPLDEGKPQGCTYDDNDNPIFEGEGIGSDGKIGLVIPTLEGVMKAHENDWIIKGVQGEFYPVKPNIFEMTYEGVE